MKWVTFISCLFLVSLAESKHLPRSYRDVGDHDTISELKEEEYKGVLLALYSQILQKATVEEVFKVTTDAAELHKKCIAADHSGPECTKPLHTAFLDVLCHEQEIAAKYGFTECCSKVDPERNECILSHKNGTRGFIPPFQKPTPEDGCKAFQDNPKHVLISYVNEVSKRYPFSKIVTILDGAKEYKGVLTTCCQDADKAACFEEKATAVTQHLKADFNRQKTICSVLRKLGEIPLLAMKIVQLSQKYPKADFATVGKLAGDIVHTYTECCKGDTLECALDRMKVSNYICSHQDTISSKVKNCCEESLLHRANCLAHGENDDKPADLSPTVREFIDNKEVCQHYTENKTLHQAKFLHEYGKRHPELSAELIVRLGKGYGDLLDKCCALDNTVECLGQGEQQLQKHIADSLEVLKTNCDLYEKAGEYLFQIQILARYTKKAPQLTFEELLKYTKQFTDAAAQCCKADDAHRLPCVEGHVSQVLGGMCRRHEEHHINKQVCKCCGDSFAFRRECFSNLGADPEYAPTPFSPDLFVFHTDLCTAEQKEQQLKKKKFLVNLMKHKPTITDEQLAGVVVDFTGMMAQCCAADNHEECFKTEGPGMVERTKTALEGN
ncbi:albumin-like [Rhineura floridana]|uniref:albumin-like n=1 Tax=Rhineura floridana TaxID=261503 RepID=UPI002AC803CB|nr:albumin-like [Rhineura floridana]